MFKEVKIGGITVPMLANGATPVRYKLLFKKDIISEFQEAQGNNAKMVDTIPELAFIMAKQAEASEGKADLSRLSMDDYIAWLERFDSMDLPFAAEDIVNLYVGNNETSSEPKKKVKREVKES